jgi:hypothetical protein
MPRAALPLASLLLAAACGGATHDAPAAERPAAERPAAERPAAATAAADAPGREAAMREAAGNVPAPLRVDRIEPDRGDVNGDTYVLIKGRRFLADGPRMVKVYFGDQQGVLVRVASDRQLIVRTPSGKPGEIVDVRIVFEPGGELVLPRAFTFIEKQPVPNEQGF